MREDPSPIEALTLPAVVEHVGGIIGELKRPPIIIGHSAGGLITQILLDHGYGAAGVAIDSVPAEGVRVVPLSQIRSLFPILRNPANRHKAVGFTPEQFHYAFTNTMSREESDEVYERYHIPASGRLGWVGVTILAGAIRGIEDPDVRFAFAILFSGTMEFNNMFASYKGEGTGAVRHMFSHHTLKPERMPLEANVWGTPKSSGSFTTLFKSRLLRALEYREAPHEIRINDKSGKPEKVWGVSEPLLDNVRVVDSFEDVTSGAVYLSCGDSANTDIPSGSVDLVVTDPPFFDNVHYSELADFFHAWQRVLLPDEAAHASAATTRSLQEVQDGKKDSFARKLRDVFAECERVLKPDGLLIFTYHHSRDDGWKAVAEAVAGAGFNFVAAQPIKSEMSVAAPKSQARDPIDIDVVLVCRKSHLDRRPALSVNDALEAAREIAWEKIGQFSRKRTPLSGTDERVIRLSQLLVALSAGRCEEDLMEAFQAARSAREA